MQQQNMPNRFTHLSEKDREFVESIEKEIIIPANNHNLQQRNNDTKNCSWIVMAVLFALHVGGMIGIVYIFMILSRNVFSDDCNMWNCEPGKDQANSAFRIGLIMSLCIHLAFTSLALLINYISMYWHRLLYIYVYMPIYYRYVKNISFLPRAVFLCIFMYCTSFFVVQSVNYIVEMDERGDEYNLGQNIGMFIFILLGIIAFYGIMYNIVKIFVYEPVHCLVIVQKAKSMIKQAEERNMRRMENMENGDAHANVPPRIQNEEGQNVQVVYPAPCAIVTRAEPKQTTVKQDPSSITKKEKVVDSDSSTTTTTTTTYSSSCDSSSDTSSSVSPTNAALDECSICNESKCNGVIRPCNHASFCYKCIKEWKLKQGTCPSCRKPIKDIIKTFK